jgi:hypothetical protein
MSDRSHSLFDNGRVIAHATVAPEASLAILSQREVNALCRGGNQPLHDLFRRCALAVLSSGAEIDDVNAPAAAFVDGEMIRGIKEHLFAVLRDVVYIANEIVAACASTSASRRHHQRGVPHPAQRARARPQAAPNLVVCWGGHSIGREEYEYTKKWATSSACAAWTSAPAAVRAR